jgi:hypothetical protein
MQRNDLPPNEEWSRARRNFLKISSLMSGMLLSGCWKDGGGGDDNERRCDPAHPNCYVSGTQLWTAGGYRKIEDIRIGDMLVGPNGDAHAVQWIGRSQLRRSNDEAWPERAPPVRIRCGALGPGAPHCDLLVSQSHRLCIDDLLIRAKDLVNGGTIFVDLCEGVNQIDYFHVKTERHAIIIASGLLSETLLLKPECRETFDNFSEFERLFILDEQLGEEPCAPVHNEGGWRSQLLSRFRSAISPLVDRRTQFDRIRDRLEFESAIAASVG